MFKTKMMMKMRTILFTTLIMLLAMSSGLFAGTYSGGSGTEGNPYQITTTADLIELSNAPGGSDDLDSYFVQTGDISFNADETQVDWDGDGSADWDTEDQKGFSPIGVTNNGPSFEGTYDGDGHTITNLYINRTTESYVGFFAAVNRSNNIVKNLGLIDVDITGNGTLGGICGALHGGPAKIENCYVTGNITSTNWLAGGLVGYLNGGEIKDSWASANINVTGYNAGGLVGWNKWSGSRIENCYVTGNISISATNGVVGGLVGENTCYVENCYVGSGVSVSGNRFVGGFSGYRSSSGYTQDCYTMANVTRLAGATDVKIGGFVGGRYGSISRCYSTGQVKYGTTLQTDKGFSGYTQGGSTTDCFWDKETSGSTTSTCTATGKTTTEMQTLATFTDVGWDFADIWTMDGVNNDGYAYLQWQPFETPNTAPIADDISVTTDEDVAVEITLTGSDDDGDELTFSIVDAPTNGVYEDGVYTPNANYFGEDTFTYVANDGELDSAPATVTITVNAILPIQNVTQGIFYATIQAAIDAAVDGDEIFIGNGIYVENLNISSSGITLTGESRDGVVIDASGGAYGAYIHADNITIQTMTIQHAVNYNIHASGGISGLTITNFAAIGQGQFVGNAGGVDLNNVNNALIDNVLSEQHGKNGIQLTASNDVTLSNVTVLNNGQSEGWANIAVYTYSSNFPELSGNVDNLVFSGNNSISYGFMGIYFEDYPNFSILATTQGTTLFTENLAPFVALGMGTVPAIDNFAENLGLPIRVTDTEPDIPTGVAYYSAFAEAYYVVSTISSSPQTALIYDIAQHIYFVGQFMTIQAAIDAAVDGDEIQVSAGTFTESLNIGTSLSLVGTEGSIIDASGFSYGIVINANNVSVSGFEIVGNEFTVAGIDIMPGTSVIAVSNNVIHGMMLPNASGSSPASYGILAWGDADPFNPSPPTNITLSENEIYGVNMMGISLGTFTENVTISGNYIHDLIPADLSEYGIEDPLSIAVQGVASNGTDVINNTFENVVVGVNIWMSIGSVSGNSFSNVGMFVSFDANNPLSVSDLPQNAFAEFTQYEGETPYLVNAYFASIQDAIDAADDGTEIIVSSGDFEEQLTVDGKSISIIGSGIGLTNIFSPETLEISFVTSNDNYCIIGVISGGELTISNLTLDGLSRGNANYRFCGVGFNNASGSVNGCELINIKDNPFSGAQHGVAIYAVNDDGTDRTVQILGCDIHGFQKNAISLVGANVIADVDGNTIVGVGMTDVTAQNGVQISYGTGNISNNIISDIAYNPNSWASSGLLIYYPSPGVSVIGNTMQDCEAANFYSGVDMLVSGNIFDRSDFSWILGGSNITFENNTVSNNSTGGYNVGLWISDATNVALNGNEFTTNDYNVIVDGVCQTITFDENVITNGDSLGVLVQSYDGAPNGLTFRRNSIVGNSIGIYNEVWNWIDAAENWWGDPTGPTVEGDRNMTTASVLRRPVFAEMLDSEPLMPTVPNVENIEIPANSFGNLRGGDLIVGRVNYIPWYADEAMTELVYPLAELSLSDGEGESGGSVTLELTMENLMDIAGIQLDFVDFPNVITLTNAVGIGRAATADIATSDLENGGVRMILYFMSGGLISAGDDAIVELAFSIAEDFEGDVTVATESLILADEFGEPIEGNATGSTISVTTPYQMTTVTIGNIAGEQGETVVLNLDMNNADPVGGLQMDIIDESGSLTYTSIAAIGRAAEFTVSASMISEWTTRLIMYSISGDVVVPGDDTIVEITYQILEDAPIGTFGLIYDAPVLSDAMGNPMPIDVINGTITISEPCLAPIANAGEDQIVAIPHDGISGGLAQVTLDGSASIDPSGGDLSYSWTLDSNEISTEATFSIELAEEDFTFVLQVENSCGLTNTDTVFVEILPEPNEPPIANAGADQEVGSDGSGAVSVTLDGSNSADPDGDSISFSWMLDGTEISTETTFTTDLEIGEYLFDLTVTDSYGTESSDQVVISVVQTATTQVISLTAGWNIFSAYVMPENLDLLAIVQPLIDAGALETVIDEGGQRIVFFMNFWMNQIGNISHTEGYYIKVNQDIDIVIEGTPVELPTSIPLTDGWNIVGYPNPMEQDALAIVQPLIDAEVFITAIDESGARIVDFIGEWMNQIGDFRHGEGYYIKVSEGIVLEIQ